MNTSSKPIVSGILAIIAGILGLLYAFTLFIGWGVVSGAFDIPGTWAIPDFVSAIVLAWAIPQVIVSILALIGGIYAVQRKVWGLAITGSIAAGLAFLPLGIPAVIITALSRDEFE